MSSKLSAHGISIALPEGWEGKIYRRHGGDPTLHAANYALPGWDGDFGSVATERMPVNGSFLVITEYRPGQGLEPGKGLFAAEAIPLPLDHREFRSRTLHIGRDGQLGFQHFFTAGKRPFCLYAVMKPKRNKGIVSAAAAKPQVSSINSVLETVTFA
jgi:hypothetical protein